MLEGSSTETFSKKLRPAHGLATDDQGCPGPFDSSERKVGVGLTEDVGLGEEAHFHPNVPVE